MSRNKRNIGFGLFLIAVCLVPAKAQTPDLARTLAAFGYRVTEQKTAVTGWEREQFRMEGKRRYAIKNRKPKSRGLYLRFVVEEEHYAREADALARLPRAHELPPGVDSKMNPEYVLREAFQQGAKVYIVSTDVLAFELEGDLKRMRERLEKAVKGRAGN